MRMPELPEVEVVRRQLQQRILGRDIANVQSESGKIVNFDDDISAKLQGLNFVTINRVGKLLVFQTSRQDVFVLCHLKMTGQLIFVDKQGRVGGGHTLTSGDLDLPHKHTHVTVSFVDGAKLFFNDMRKFGYFKLASFDTVEKEKLKYGVEPIANSYKLCLFSSLLAKRKTSIKAFLLNQKYLAGLGNIYVDEACFRARVKPQRVAGNLNPKEQKALFAACRDVLLESIDAGGTTFYDFTDATGGKGGFSKALRVFQREGQKCYRCSELVLKERFAGRGTHWCPGCQK